MCIFVFVYLFRFYFAFPYNSFSSALCFRLQKLIIMRYCCEMRSAFTGSSIQNYQINGLNSVKLLSMGSFCISHLDHCVVVAFSPLWHRNSQTVYRFDYFAHTKTTSRSLEKPQKVKNCFSSCGSVLVRT